jgi:hypothetical protein
MRKLFPLLTVALVSSFALALAAEVKTVTGDAVCAKCALGESKTCQNTITTNEGGKKVTYYLAKNKFFGTSHKSLGICGASKDAPVKVKATGDVEEKDGKMVLTPTSEITKAD